MTKMSSQITSLMVVYSSVYSDADQRKQQSSALLAFVWGIHRDRWIPRHDLLNENNIFQTKNPQTIIQRDLIGDKLVLVKVITWFQIDDKTCFKQYWPIFMTNIFVTPFEESIARGLNRLT